MKVCFRTDGLTDCEDPECYRDLARIRGLKHISWTDMTKLTPVASSQAKPGYNVEAAVAKFQDYKFDPKEVLRRVCSRDFPGREFLGIPGFFREFSREQ